MTQGPRRENEPAGLAGVVVPVGPANLLLPNAAVAEIIPYRTLRSVEGGPDWLLGDLDWRDLRIPAISIAGAMGTDAEPESGRRPCLIVCRTTVGAPTLPNLALIATAAPWLARFQTADLAPSDAGNDRPFVLHALTYAGQPAWIPDMVAVERALVEALLHGIGGQDDSAAPAE